MRGFGLACCSGCAGASYAVDWTRDVGCLLVNVDGSCAGRLDWTDGTWVGDRNRVWNGICNTDRYGCINDEE